MSLERTTDVRYGDPVVSVIPHVPRTRLKHPPLCPEDRLVLKEQRNREATEIASDLADWHEEIREKAVFLATKHDKTPHYFIQLLFNSPTDVNSERKANFRNAWAWHLARDRTSVGNGSGQLFELMQQHADEYDELLHPENEEKRNKILEEYKAEREHRKYSTQIGQKSKAATFNAGVKNIEACFNQLCSRVDVEGFFCLFQNSPNFRLLPVWWFSRPTIEDYLPIAIGRLFDTYTAGARLEAFAIAGCSLQAEELNMSSKKKVLMAKARLRSLIGRQLGEYDF